MRFPLPLVFALGLGLQATSVHAAPITINFGATSSTLLDLSTISYIPLGSLEGSVSFDISGFDSYSTGYYRTSTGCRGIYTTYCTGGMEEDTPFITNFSFNYDRGSETLPSPLPTQLIQNTLSVGHGSLTISGVADAAAPVSGGFRRSLYSFSLTLQSAGFSTEWAGDTLPTITGGSFRFEDFAEFHDGSGSTPWLPGTRAYPYWLDANLSTVNGQAIGPDTPTGSVPEPASPLLVGLGILAAGMTARRRMRR